MKRSYGLEHPNDVPRFPPNFDVSPEERQTLIRKMNRRYSPDPIKIRKGKNRNKSFQHSAKILWANFNLCRRDYFYYEVIPFLTETD